MRWTDLKRGDVVRVRLDPVEGHEQAGTRPVLIVSPDPMNALSPVILIACITSKKTQRIFKVEVLLEPPEGGLSQRSKVMLNQLRTIDKVRIYSRYGSVSAQIMSKVDEALKLAAGLVAV